MSNEDKTFSGSLALDLRIWLCHLHTLYTFIGVKHAQGSDSGHSILQVDFVHQN